MHEEALNCCSKVSIVGTTPSGSILSRNRNLKHRSISFCFIGTCCCLLLIACLAIFTLCIRCYSVKVAQTEYLLNSVEEPSHIRLPNIYGRWADEQLAGGFPQYNPKKRSRAKLTITTTTTPTTTTTVTTTTTPTTTTPNPEIVDITKDSWNYRNHEAENERFDRYLTGSERQEDLTTEVVTRVINRRLRERTSSDKKSRMNFYKIRAFDWGRAMWSNQSGKFVNLVAEPDKTTNFKYNFQTVPVEVEETIYQQYPAVEEPTVRIGEVATNQHDSWKIVSTVSDFEYPFVMIEPGDYDVLLNNSDPDVRRRDSIDVVTVKKLANVPETTTICNCTDASSTFDNLTLGSLTSDGTSANVCTMKIEFEVTGNMTTTDATIADSADSTEIESESERVISWSFRVASDKVTAYDNAFNLETRMAFASTDTRLEGATKMGKIRSRDKIPPWWMGTSKNSRRRIKKRVPSTKVTKIVSTAE